MDRNQMVPSAHDFKLEAEIIIRRSLRNSITGNRRYKAFFGISPDTCARIWFLIGRKHPEGSKPKHLLWGLMFLRLYATEYVHASIAMCDEKTFRKWSLKYVSLMSHLEVVSNIYIYRKA